MIVVATYNPWYSSSGCDCCEPTEMPSYTLHIDGTLQVTEDGTPMQFYDDGEIAIHVLHQLGIRIDIDYDT